MKKKRHYGSETLKHESIAIRKSFHTQLAFAITQIEQRLESEYNVMLGDSIIEMFLAMYVHNQHQ